MTTPLSVAVIGGGMAGRTHANAWRQAVTIYEPGVIPELRFAAICDAHEPFATAAAQSYGYDRAVTDWREIAADESIDIVSIVVANSLHREIAEALMKAGKHVLCEKPLTDNLEDARAMVEAEEASDVVTGIGFSYRRQPAIAKLAELRRDGLLGDVFHFDGRYWCDYGLDPMTPIAWRYRGPAGSGALGDVGSHLIDIAEFICGPIRAVSGGRFATVIKRRPPAQEGVAGGRGLSVAAEATETVENDDIASFNAEFVDGSMGTFSVSRVAFGDANGLAFEVLGSKGRAHFDMSRAGEILLSDDCVPQDLQGMRRVLVGPTFPYFKDGSSMAFPGVGVTQIDQFTYQARAFLNQILGIDESLPPVPTFAHGYRAMQIQDAIARSAASGGSAIEID